MAIEKKRNRGGHGCFVAYCQCLQWRVDIQVIKKLFPLLRMNLVLKSQLRKMPHSMMTMFQSVISMKKRE
ncbi:unnamed protein product [Brassica oleracea var. botrytis]|uniref:(rape) hypothetical protein n=1 Tax=Brassica napus TaxID=3708 RepID=A0A816IQW1_BRANA|nr:unnamed protein product [Brassica napus]